MNLEEYLDSKENQENELVVITNEILSLEKQLASFKELEAKYNEEKEKLRQSMIKYGVDKWETTNGVKIKLVEDKPDEEVEETYYDEVKFMTENAELHNEYVATKEKYRQTRTVLKKGKKGYVRITLPKEKTDE